MHWSDIKFCSRPMISANIHSHCEKNQRVVKILNISCGKYKHFCVRMCFCLYDSSRASCNIFTCEKHLGDLSPPLPWPPLFGWLMASKLSQLRQWNVLSNKPFQPNKPYRSNDFRATEHDAINFKWQWSLSEQTLLQYCDISEWEKIEGRAWFYYSISVCLSFIYLFHVLEAD